MSRLEPADPKRLTGEDAAVAARIAVERAGASGLYHQLLHSPSFAAGWLALSRAVRSQGVLEEPLRELVILQVGRILRTSYEYSHHVVIARRAGVTDAQIAALAEAADSPLFSLREQAALAYAAVLTEQARVPDEVFARARAAFSDQEIVELTITAAFYNMVCRFLVAMQVEAEPDLEPPPFTPAR
jgi:alkylhydroperoxidase family enzyme